MFAPITVFVFLGLLIGESLSASDIEPLSLDNIASIQKNEDLTYSVICQNDSRETVSNVDLKLDNVCPKLVETADLGITSIQKNADGSFQVVCTDKSVRNATKEEVLDGSVCRESEIVNALTEGTYVAQSNPYGFCDQQIKPTYQNGQLDELELQFCSNSWFTMSCANKLCEGKHPSWPSNSLEVFVTAQDTYIFRRYTNDALDGEATFVKAQPQQ